MSAGNQDLSQVGVGILFLGNKIRVGSFNNRKWLEWCEEEMLESGAAGGGHKMYHLPIFLKPPASSTGYCNE